MPRRDFEADAVTKARIDRARLLASAGLDDWADAELRFGARTDSQRHVLALELALMAESRGAHDQAIRSIKSLAGGYLSIPFDAAPDKFWVRVRARSKYQGRLQDAEEPALQHVVCPSSPSTTLHCVQLLDELKCLDVLTETAAQHH